MYDKVEGVKNFFERNALIRKVTFAVLAMVLVSLISVPSGAQTTADRSESCRKFVQDFYNWYFAEVAKRDKHPNLPSPYETVMTKRTELLSPALLKALREDDEAQAKNPSEIVGLDEDPFTLSQDFEDSYVAGTPAMKDESCRVPLYGIRSGKKLKEPSFSAEAQFVNGNWQFVDFHRVSDGKSYDLLGELRTIKATRDKDPNVKK